MVAAGKPKPVNDGSSTVITMPVAGPTPGNGDFANYLSKTVTVQAPWINFVLGQQG
jgi:hypothetical protein